MATKYCEQCGAEISASAAFCEACGADLESEQAGDGGAPHESARPTPHPSEDGISWGHVASAIAIALIPAFGAYTMVTIATNDVVGAAFLVSLPVFAYLLYRRPTRKGMIGGMFFWLAVESFLSPLVMLFYTAAYTSEETTTAAEEAGAAIGGTVLVIGAFVIGVPLGIVFYLISRRLESNSG